MRRLGPARELPRPEELKSHPNLIETERLLPRPPVPGDLSFVAEAIADVEVMRFISLGETGTIDAAAGQVAAMRRA
jgi:hypothetical protein